MQVSSLLRVWENFLPCRTFALLMSRTMLTRDAIASAMIALTTNLRECRDPRPGFDRWLGDEVDLGGLDADAGSMLSRMFVTLGVLDAELVIFARPSSSRTAALATALRRFECARRCAPDAELAEVITFDEALVVVAGTLEAELDLDLLGLLVSARTRLEVSIQAHEFDDATLAAVPFHFVDVVLGQTESIFPNVIARLDQFLAVHTLRDRHRELAREWRLRLRLLLAQDGYGLDAKAHLELIDCCREDLECVPLDQRRTVREWLDNASASIRSRPWWRRVGRRRRPSPDDSAAAFATGRANPNDLPLLSVPFVAGPFVLPAAPLLRPAL
jgi:hypothetical protein